MIAAAAHAAFGTRRHAALIAVDGTVHALPAGSTVALVRVHAVVARAAVGQSQRHRVGDVRDAHAGEAGDLRVGVHVERARRVVDDVHAAGRGAGDPQRVPGRYREGARAGQPGAEANCVALVATQCRNATVRATAESPSGIP